MRLDSVIIEGRLRFSDWSNSLYLSRWDDNRQVNFNANWSDNVELRFAVVQGLLEIDFNQPPSIRPISLQVESSCW